MAEKETTQNNGKGERTTEVAYQNKDIVSKVMAEEFEGKSFAVYGIDIPKIVKVEPTNLPAIEANELRMDNLFLLEDESYALVDYESDYSRDNMHKYLNYVVRASKRLYNDRKIFPKIRMIVIYTADVERGTTNPELDMGSLKFKVTEAFLSEFNHEKVWRNISNKIVTGEDIDSEEIMGLIIYPLAFKEREEKQVAIRQVIELAKGLKDDKIKIFILKCLMVFSDKVIREEDARHIKEVIMMTKVERLIYEDAENDVATRIAKNLLKTGSEVDYVSENTGLSKDIVIQLVADIAKEKEQ